MGEADLREVTQELTPHQCDLEPARTHCPHALP